MPRKLANLIALLLIKFIVFTKRQISTNELFNTVWQILHANFAYRILVNFVSISGRGGKPTFNETIYRLISNNIPGFYSSLELPLPERLNNQIKQKNAFLILHFHEGFNFVSKILISQNRNFTRLAHDPESYLRSLSEKFSDLSCANVIAADIFSLAMLKKAIKNGDAICSALDYRAEKKGPYSYVSPVLIEFANKNRLDVYFLKSNISDNGVVELFCWGPFKNLDPHAGANSFIKLFNSYGESRRNLTVKKPNAKLHNN